MSLQHYRRLHTWQTHPTTVYTLYLPLTHNDGSRMRPERLRHAMRELLRFAPGLTRHAPGVGYWFDPSAKLYRDLVLPIQVLLPSTPELDGQLIYWLATMTPFLEQQQLFLFSSSASLIQLAS